MDIRPLSAGLIGTGSAAAGAVILGAALSLPVIAVLGLLLMITPVSSLILLLLARLNRLEAEAARRDLIIRRTMDDQTESLRSQNRETAERVERTVNELSRRVYR